MHGAGPGGTNSVVLGGRGVNGELKNIWTGDFELGKQTGGVVWDVWPVDQREL